MKSMNSKLKNALIVVLFALLLIMMCFVMIRNPINVKATSQEVSIEMINGASVRVDGEHRGMRFAAKINNYDSTDGIKYGMIIVPEDYLLLEEVTSKSNPDYISIFTDKELPLLNFYDMLPYIGEYEGVEGTYLRGVLSNVLYENLNRSFYAIAYYDDGQGYTYAEVNKTDNCRSFAQVVNSALGDEVFLSKLSDDGKQNLLEFNYNAVHNSLAGSQDALKEFNGKDNLDAFNEIYGTNVLASFNYDCYAGYVFRGNSTNRVITIVDDNAVSSKVLRVRNNYAGSGTITLKFVNQVKVTSDSMVNIKVKSDLDSITVGKNEILLNNNEEYFSIQLYATHLGFKVGDVIDKMQITMPNTGNLYIDEISVFENVEFRTALISKLNGYEVANYDDENYNIFVQNGTVADGNLTLSVINYNSSNSFVEMVKTNTVLDANSGKESYVAIRINAEMTKVRIWNSTMSAGTDYPSLLHTADRGNWGIAYTPNTWVTVIVKLTDIGYVAGDTFDTIHLTAWGDNNGELMIDFVDYFELDSGKTKTQVYDYYNSTIAKERVKVELAKKLNGYEVANYDSTEDYNLFVENGTVADGYLNLSLKNYTSVNSTVKMVKANTVLDASTGKESFVVLRVKSDVNRICIYNSTIEAGTNYPAFLWHVNNGWGIAYTAGEWATLIVKLTDIGFSAGDTFDTLHFSTWKTAGTLTIDYIEYVELDAGITKVGVALNAYNALKTN